MGWPNTISLYLYLYLFWYIWLLQIHPLVTLLNTPTRYNHLTFIYIKHLLYILDLFSLVENPPADSWKLSEFAYAWHKLDFLKNKATNALLSSSIFNLFSTVERFSPVSRIWDRAVYKPICKPKNKIAKSHTRYYRKNLARAPLAAFWISTTRLRSYLARRIAVCHVIMLRNGKHGAYW